METETERKKVFIIKDNKLLSYFQDLKWVLKACLTGKKVLLHENLKCLFVDKDFRFVATDGSRCHIATLKDLPDDIRPEPGSYEVTEAKKQVILMQVDMTAPDYSAVFPALKETGPDIVLRIPALNSDPAFSVAYATLIKRLPINAIQINFFKDMADEVWNVQVGDGTGPVRFSTPSGDKDAVLMPCRVG